MTQHSTCVSTSREEGSPPSASWEMLFLMQPRRLLDFCPNGTLLVPVQLGTHQGPQGPFLQSCFSASPFSACTSAQGCSSLGCRSCHLCLLNFMRLLSAHFSGLLRSLETAAQPSGVSQFCIVCKCEGALLSHCPGH